jgi:hypothetical protein
MKSTTHVRKLRETQALVFIAKMTVKAISGNAGKRL